VIPPWWALDAPHKFRASSAILSGHWQTALVPKRLRFVTAQLGRKPGAERSLRMLPDVSDLHGDGWIVLDERSWRTGNVGNPSEWESGLAS